MELVQVFLKAFTLSIYSIVDPHPCFMFAYSSLYVFSIQILSLNLNSSVSKVFSELITFLNADSLLFNRAVVNSFLFQFHLSILQICLHLRPHL